MGTQRQDLDAALEALKREDWETAHRSLRVLAEDGLAEAEYHYGMLHLHGRGVGKDAGTAVVYLRRAAEKGHVDARYRLACCYRDGLGVEDDRDPDETPILALSWFMLAAGQDHADARRQRDDMIGRCGATDLRWAINTVKSQALPVPAGWLADPQAGSAVWAPSWYRYGTYRLELEVESAEGCAHGFGRATLFPVLPEDAKRVFEGRFQNGFFVGERPIGQAFEGLPDDDYLIELPDAGALPHRGVALWLRNAFHDLTLSLASRGPVMRAQVYVRVPRTFDLMDDDRVQGLMTAAAAVYDRLCKLDSHVPVTLLPEDHAMAFEAGKTVFQPVAAEGIVVGFDEPGRALSVSSFRNHARRAAEERAAEEKRRREREERERERAETAAKAAKRAVPEVRGLTLGLSLAELRETLAEEIADWQPAWKPDRPLPPYAQFEQSVRLTDGATVKASFTSPVNGSQLFCIVYEQYLRDGPLRPDLVRSLKEKYGEPDSVTGQGAYRTYGFPSRAPDSVLGALMTINIRVDRESGKVSQFSVAINDAGFGEEDERQAYAQQREDERLAFERNKGDEVKF